MLRQTPRAAGRRRRGCGRRTPGRSGPPAASTCPGRGRRGTRATSTRYARSQPRDQRRAVCGAPRSGELSGVHSPASTRPISSRIAIMASQNRSSSAEVLALGRLHHQRARHREAHRRRVEAVVDEPLRDVVDGDAARPWSGRAGRGCTRGRRGRRGRGRAPGSGRSSRSAT